MSDETEQIEAKKSGIADLIALTKPRLSQLVILTAAGGWWLAPTTPNNPNWKIGVIAVGGTTITVAAANALNNYLERESDKFMVRTKNRPLPSGRMNPKTALIFGLILSFISIPLLTLAVNPLTGLLAAIALITYVLIYTPMKKTTSFHTIVGAIPGAMPPLIGWTAATDSIDAGGMMLFTILFLWQIPHSLAITIYRQSEYDHAGLIVLSSDRGLHATRFQMLMWTLVILPVPMLLFLTKVSGWGTMIVGTILGIWWTAQAWKGFNEELGPKWARKFFLSSLVYLSVLYLVMAGDGIYKWIKQDTTTSSEATTLQTTTDKAANAK